MEDESRNQKFQYPVQPVDQPYSPPGYATPKPGGYANPQPGGYANPQFGGYATPQAGSPASAQVYMYPTQPAAAPVVVVMPSAEQPVSMVGPIVVSCLLYWLWPFSMICTGIAFILAMVGNSSAESGDRQGALKMRKISYIMSIVGAVCGVIILIIIIAVCVSAARAIASSSPSSTCYSYNSYGYRYYYYC